MGEVAGRAAAASGAASQGRSASQRRWYASRIGRLGSAEVKRQLETIECGGGESRVLPARCRQVERPADRVGQRWELAGGRRGSGDAGLGADGGPGRPFTAPDLAHQRQPEPVEGIGPRSGERLEPPGLAGPAERLADPAQQRPLGPVVVVDQSLGAAGLGGHPVDAPALEAIPEQHTWWRR